MKIALPVMFACVPKNVRITRAACGKRHHLAAKGPDRRGQRCLDDRTCANCEIGRAHSRGEEPWHWPDGTPITAVAASSTSAPPSATKEGDRDMVAKDKTITFQGRTATIAQWAEELGITAQALHFRLTKGWPLERALTSPRSDRQPKGHAKRAAKESAPTTSLDEIATTIAELERAPAPAPSLDASSLASPADALTLLGYNVISAIRTPRGLALIVEGT